MSASKTGVKRKQEESARPAGGKASPKSSPSASKKVHEEKKSNKPFAPKRPGSDGASPAKKAKGNDGKPKFDMEKKAAGIAPRKTFDKNGQFQGTSKPKPKTQAGPVDKKKKFKVVHGKYTKASIDPSKKPFVKKAGPKDDAAATKEDETEGGKLTGKELRDKRRSLKTHFELLNDAKQLWEQVRVHEMEESERAPLMEELMECIQGKVHDIIFKHDGTRIIQTCLMYGSHEQRNSIVEELKGHVVELAKFKYSKHIVTKMLKYCEKPIREKVVSEFVNWVRQCVRHREASAILEEAYRDHANAAQRTALIEEFYGPQFKVFKTESGTLADMFAAHPDKKGYVMKFLQESLSNCLDKGTIANSIVHRPLLEFHKHASPSEITDMIHNTSEVLVEILHTHDGSRVAMRSLWHGDAKDRKTIIKSLKTHVAKIATDSHGHLVLCALFDCVDDTKLVGQAIISEISENIVQIAQNTEGRKVLVHLLRPRAPQFFCADTREQLAQGDGNAFSKKDAPIRQAELLAAVSPALLKLVVESGAELARNKQSMLLIPEIILHVKGDKTAALNALAEACAVEDESSLMTNPFSHRMIKRLIAEHTPTEGQSFAEILLAKLAGRLSHWAVQPCATFVCIGLCEAPSTAAKAKAELAPHAKSFASSTLKGVEALAGILGQKKAPAAIPNKKGGATVTAATPKKAREEEPVAEASVKKAKTVTNPSTAPSTPAAVKKTVSASVATPKKVRQAEDDAEAQASAAPATAAKKVKTPAPTPKRNVAAAPATPAQAVATPKGKAAATPKAKPTPKKN